MEQHCDYSKWFYLCLALIGALVVLFIISHRYNLKWKEKSIELEMNDKRHEAKHVQNEQRIKSLESEIKDLKEIILEKTKKRQN